jgi:hypothetical protein
MQTEFKKSCIIVLNRYDTNKLFIIDCITKIDTIYSKVKEFGETQAKDMVYVLTKAHKDINKYLENYNTYSSDLQEFVLNNGCLEIYIYTTVALRHIFVNSKFFSDLKYFPNSIFTILSQVL